MSYDIYLKDPVSNENIKLPFKHLMTGGTYVSDYDEKTGTFSPAAISEAWLNITYNYANYYYEAAAGDDRFFGKLVDDRENDESRNLGIRGIYGKSGAESIPMLKDMVNRIRKKYQTSDGNLITTQWEKTKLIDINGNDIDLHDILSGKLPKDYKRETYVISVNEGPDPDYWEPTAANAIKPLLQLVTMAQLRPDGIWSGD